MGCGCSTVAAADASSDARTGSATAERVGDSHLRASVSNGGLSDASIDGGGKPNLAPGCEVESENEQRERLQRSVECRRSLKAHDGRLVVRGTLQRANVPNRNGRVYPKHVIKREIERYARRTHLGATSSGRRRLAMGRGTGAFGELDHPPPESKWFRKTNRANVSHVLLEYGWEGDDLVGVVEVLPTECGNVLRELSLMGEELGVSSRGWASLLPASGGTAVIQEDFELITFDFVPDPSTAGAYLRPVDPQHRLTLEPLATVLSRLARVPASDDECETDEKRGCRERGAEAPTKAFERTDKRVAARRAAVVAHAWT